MSPARATKPNLASAEKAAESDNRGNVGEGGVVAEMHANIAWRLNQGSNGELFEDDLAAKLSRAAGPVLFATCWIGVVLYAIS